MICLLGSYCIWSSFWRIIGRNGYINYISYITYDSTGVVIFD
ncbi:MAG: hypothetical protein P857_379 [Candidatus Xenolissoclinum pacificiensis L6]|uniref:Uncharacterized protein n=1 Tax=Candidatus Xenolissoclinum pacificiensis L6 TaxID=1401685 RepID=W2UZQ8_9RICK|nr:MAG: hypothetical protein P857_379 [Candidatus Xenolissoclinum pacificiensis L6]